MATIEVRGYVSKPQAKETKTGKKYSQFFLGSKQKDLVNGEEKVTWANFLVKDFKNSSPPVEKSFVTLKGYLKVSEYEKEGVRRTSLEVNATELEVSPPSDKGTTPAATPEKDPWEE